MKLTVGTMLAILALPMAATAAAVPDTTDSKIAPEEFNPNYTPKPASIYAADVGATINETEVTALSSRSPQNCGLHVQWTSNWPESGWRRYRVEAWAYQGQFHANTFGMLEAWCRFFYERAYGNPALVNAQCHVTGGNYAFGDISSYEGSNGHSHYRNLNQEAVNSWRHWTQYNCDVNSNF